MDSQARKARKEMESQKVFQSKASAEAKVKPKISRNRSSNGVMVNKKAINRLCISNINSLQAKASIKIGVKVDPTQAQAKASQHPFAGRVADKVTHQVSVGAKPLNNHKVVVKCKDCGVQAQSYQRSLVPSWTFSEVKRCGQKWSLMYDSGAALSVAPPSFAPHVPLQPIMRDQNLLSVTAAGIKIHGFKRCNIMSGGIGLRFHFSLHWYQDGQDWQALLNPFTSHGPITSMDGRVRSMHPCLRSHTMASVAQTLSLMKKSQIAACR
eukprot:373091-Amphidinium_carterae.1